MAQKEIFDFTAKDPVIATDEFILQETGGGAVKKTTVDTVSDYVVAVTDQRYLKVTTVGKTADYVILDNDGYGRIEVDTTSGEIDITLPLLANNAARRIEIALVKNDASLDKVIIAPHATDANKLTEDLLAAVWLTKAGDFLVLQASATAGCWVVVNERISAQFIAKTFAGVGSVNNKIVRYTTVVESFGCSGQLLPGGMFTENHSTGYQISDGSGASNAAGLEFVILRSGVYAFAVEITAATTQATACITLNAPDLTTAGYAITDPAIRIAVNMEVGSTYPVTTSRTMRFKKGDIVRHQAEGATATTGNIAMFSCTYLGN